MQKTNWSPELATPLVQAHISISDVLARGKQSVVVVGEDQRVTVVYEKVLLSKNGYEILPLIDSKLEVLAGITSYPLAIANGTILQYLRFSKGEMILSLTGGGRAEIGRVEVSIPSLQLQGQPYAVARENITVFREVVDLVDAELIFNTGSGNEIDILFNVYDLNGIDISANFKLVVSFRDMLVKTARGWFDNLKFDLPRDTISLDIFKNWRQGAIHLEDPKAHLAFSNSFGIRISGSLSTFNAALDEAGVTVIPIDFSNALGDSFAIEYPTSEEIEGYVNSVFTLDGTNSNITNVITVSPKHIRYDLALVARHDILSSEPGFIHDTSRVVVATSVELPITGRIEDILVTDTLQVTPDFIRDLKNVEHGIIHIRTHNALPVDVDLQAYFLDNDKVVLDSLLATPDFLRSGTVNAEGRVVAASEVKNAVIVSGAKLAQLENARYLAIKGHMASADGGGKTISFHSDNYLAIDLSLLLKYRIQ